MQIITHFHAYTLFVQLCTDLVKNNSFPDVLKRQYAASFQKAYFCLCFTNYPQ